MMDSYHCATNGERRAALREIVQELALVGLSRTHFFTHAAFYGGTALRIFHSLERFSEDLDFSLTQCEPGFSIETYLGAVRDELSSWGFEMSVERKQKEANAAIQSAFIKGGTLIHLVKIAAIEPPVPGVPPNEQLKVKLEIDTNPPAHASFETKYRLEPIPYSVRVYDLPSLFAGKAHALLCRKWKDRVKGRDFFDYVWYLSQGVELNLAHLEARMRQSGHWVSGPLTESLLRQLLEERFASVDYAQAKADAAPYVMDSRALGLWGVDFFISITRERLKIKA
jgi:predicted nucleotidyltransferase component of viral defense system